MVFTRQKILLGAIMTQFVDRRLNSKNKSTVNRQRFIRRFKDQIKAAVANAASKRSITDIQNGEKISIPKKDIDEPTFRHGAGGRRETVYAGNKEFLSGDKIQRPPSQSGPSQGSGGEASDQGEGTDDFIFELNKDEFLEIFFEDLELPDLLKTKLMEIPNYSTQRLGISTQGVPTNIDIVRSFRNALGRRIAFSMPYKTKLLEAEEQLKKLLKSKAKNSPENNSEIELLEKSIEELKRKIKAVPFIDTSDVRYHNILRVPKPTTRAVMFCIMDVSGSMDEAKKEIAKRFFILIYLFLTKSYEKIHLVFIRHHTTAKEVDENEFFYSRETGGTVVSSALELLKSIITERYPTSDWNIYCAQASDGDNWNADSPRCEAILNEEIMPLVQYFSYVEIMPRHHQSLWRSYLGVQKSHHNFAMQSINSISEILPIFRELFKRKAS